MSWEQIRDIAAWLGGVISPVLGVLAWLSGKRVQKLEERVKRFELGEHRYRSKLALNIEVTPRLFEADGDVVLETTVRVHNLSTRTWCFPAIYASARPLRVQALTKPLVEKAGYQLGRIPGISAPHNIVWFDDALVQMTPQEIETFLRIDRIPRATAETCPLLLIIVDVFGTTTEVIGKRKPNDASPDALQARRRWLTLMQEADGIRHRSVVFARWPLDRPVVSDLIAPGDWYLRVPPTDPDHDTDDPSQFQPDVANTRLFRESVLDPLWLWTRMVVVDLRTGRAAGLGQAPQGRLSAGQERS